MCLYFSRYQQNKEAWIAGFTEASPCSGTDVNVRYSDCSSVLSSSLNTRKKCPSGSQCMSVHLDHHMHWETCSTEISFICETEGTFSIPDLCTHLSPTVHAVSSETLFDYFLIHVGDAKDILTTGF